MKRYASLFLILMTVLAQLAWAYDAYCTCEAEQVNHQSTVSSSCCACETECPVAPKGSDNHPCDCEKGCDHEFTEEPSPATSVSSDNHLIKYLIETAAVEQKRVKPYYTPLKLSDNCIVPNVLNSQISLLRTVVLTT
ncbi:MAG: hypothetical protein JNL74_07090 [Fibrobacteres bacterium]|nr:hypothetical protein [Fibrobacterota bacterium]